MWNASLSAESNHLKVTPTPEPLSLTIFIFFHLAPTPEKKKEESSRRPIAKRSIDPSSGLIEKIVPHPTFFLFSFLFLFAPLLRSKSRDSRVKNFFSKRKREEC